MTLNEPDNLDDRIRQTDLGTLIRKMDFLMRLMDDPVTLYNSFTGHCLHEGSIEFMMDMTLDTFIASSIIHQVMEVYVQGLQTGSQNSIGDTDPIVDGLASMAIEVLTGMEMYEDFFIAQPFLGNDESEETEDDTESD